MKNTKSLSTKTILSVLCASVLCILFSCAAFAEETAGVSSFSVNPYGNAQDAADTVRWLKSNDGYTLYLPSGTNVSEMKVYFSADDTVTVDGTVITSGDETAFFTQTDKTYTVSCGDKNYSLRLLTSGGTPAVFITTDTQPLRYIHANKENKDSGWVRIHKANGKVDVDAKMKQLKGRGNATWSYPKKPYNIKFDKKTSVLGMDKAKKWTFLAGYAFDNALMKNASVLEIGADIGLHETSDFRHVDLYINGEYLGSYLLCESIEIGDNRIETVDLDKANEDVNTEEEIENAERLGVRGSYVPGSKKWVNLPNEPEDVTGGYLLEVDYLYRYHDEISGFISNVGMPIVVKSPEYASEKEINYISTLWNEAEDALYSDTGYNTLGKHYTEYFDMESLEKVYIMQELSKNVDSGITSFYFYKTAESDRFFAGPLWDFDHALGAGTNVSGGLTIWEPDTWYANQLRRNSIDGSCSSFMTFFAKCYEKEDFRSGVSALWTGGISSMLADGKRQELQQQSDAMLSSAVMNHIRWMTYNTADTATVAAKYGQDVTALFNFIFTRKEALDKGFAEDGAVVYYRKNGGGGSNQYDSKIYSVGETATAKNCVFSMSGYEFDGWNTSADGTGLAVAAGESFTVDGNYVNLYAQWKVNETPEEQPEEQPEECDCLCHQNGFAGFIWRIVKLIHLLLGVSPTCKCGASHY